MALPKLTTPTYELEIPSTDEKIKYRPFLVKEEKILMMALESKSEKDITQAVKDIVSECTFNKVNIDERNALINHLPKNYEDFIGNKVSIAHPEIKTKESFERNIPRRLHGIYSSTEKLITEGVTQKYFVKIIFNLLNSVQNHIKENLSTSILKEYKLIDRYKAIVNIHLPESQELLSLSIRRLKFDEHFFFQLLLALRKSSINSLNTKRLLDVGPYFRPISESLNF